MKRRRIATNRATEPTAANVHAYYLRQRRIGQAIPLLKAARDILREAGATNAHAATTRAIKSTTGAHNHAIELWIHLRGRSTAAQFERHRARDPHCTCNDCIAWLATSPENDDGEALRIAREGFDFDTKKDQDESPCALDQGADRCETCASMGLCPRCGSASPWRCGHFDADGNEIDDDDDEQEQVDDDTRSNGPRRR